MKLIERLEKRIGGSWTGVKFHRDPTGTGNVPDAPSRPCRAVTDARVKPVTLNAQCIDCPGALRSLGWDKGTSREVTKILAQKAKVPMDIARKAVEETPRMDEKIEALTIGKVEDPDLVLSYAQPEAVMRLLRRFLNITGQKATTSLSTVMTVCGDLIVGAYETGQIRITFGCPDAREHSDMGRDRLAVAIPRALVEKLLAEED